MQYQKIANGGSTLSYNLPTGTEPNNVKRLYRGLDEYSTSKKPNLLVWSASEESSLQRLSGQYRTYIGSNELNIEATAYTLAARRTRLAWRDFIVTGLEERSDPGTINVRSVKASNDRRLAFVFTGQGAHWAGMGSQLLSFPVFNQSIESSDRCLKELGCAWSLYDNFGGKHQDLQTGSPKISQPLTTCLQLALVDLLRSLGVVPSAVLGHSSGEIASAYAAGALSRFSAVKVAYFRGELSSRLENEVKGSAMMAVGLSTERVLPYLERLREINGGLHVTLGCVNSPINITLTGDKLQLAALQEWLNGDAVFSRMLRIPIAYHSSYMTAIAHDYQTAMGQLEKGRKSGFVPMISSVTADIVTPDSLTTTAYWVRNLTSTVHFAAAFQKVLGPSNKKPRKQLGRKSPQDFWVTDVMEIGPHTTLRGPIREMIRASSLANKPTYIPSLVRDIDSSAALLEAVGNLYCAGYPVDILLANNLDGTSRQTSPNLPKYPFNHKQSYWKEGRLSRNFWFQKVPRHELLGIRNLDWNPQMAQWRSIIRLREVSWLKDHTINGQVIMPAAGMVSIAIEALSQVTDDAFCLRAIQIKNIRFLHPISFPQDGDSVETQLTLSTESRIAGRSPWSEFRLFVMDEQDYSECCNGSIRAIAGDTTMDSKAPSSVFRRKEPVDEWLKTVLEGCQGPELDPYTMSMGSAVQYGPCFRNIENLRVGRNGLAVAKVNTESWQRKDKKVLEAYVIHPSTLDGLAQLLVPALAAHEKIHLATMLPTYVANIWVNCSLLEAEECPGLLATARYKPRGYRGASADVVATRIGSNEPLVYFEDLETTFISDSDLRRDKQSQSRALCTRIDTKPDIGMMDHTQILSECTCHRPPELPGTVRNFRLLMVAILSFVEEAIVAVEQDSITIPERHLKAYVVWLKYQQQRTRSGESPVGLTEVQQLLSDNDAREQLISEVESMGVEGSFFMYIGRNLIKVLCGDLDPLDLMFRSGLADRYYEQMLANEHHAHPASAYVNLLCFRNPSMKILEVGAGTGGQTMRILEKMGANGVKRWAQYDYTDISPGFFAQAKNKFHEYVDQMNFRVCDISKDPVSQSFEVGTYDLVLASHVLHATDDLHQSLRNVRKLLKAGGRLLLFETTQPDALHIGFAFGLLKGWWSPLDHESRSAHSPCLTCKSWDEYLKSTGFSGVDVEIPGQEQQQCRYSSIMISTATDDIGCNMIAASQHITLVRRTGIEEHCTIAEQVEEKLTTEDFTCTTHTLAELVTKSDLPASATIIFLLEVKAVFLAEMSAIEYTEIKAVFTKYPNVIWVTETMMSGREPLQHLADGLGRTLASEDSRRKFVTLALSVDDFRSGYRFASNVVCSLVRGVSATSVEELETNYTIERGMLHINRIVENRRMDEEVAQSMLPRQKTVCQLTADTRIALHMRFPGYLDTLEWKSYEEVQAQPPLVGDEVLVDVKAFGVTMRDYQIVRGQLNELDLGIEAAGVVQAVGKLSRFQPGDRVCLLSPCPTRRSTVRIKDSAVAIVPFGLGLAEAASLPEALWLAFHALAEVARLQKGETVLIHEACSPVGQLAIQLAREIGANVLATANSIPQIEFLEQELKVSREAMLLTKDNFFSTQIHQIADIQGIDIIVGSLPDEDKELFSRLLAPFGRLIDVGAPHRTDTAAGRS